MAAAYQESDVAAQIGFDQTQPFIAQYASDNAIVEEEVEEEEVEEEGGREFASSTVQFELQQTAAVAAAASAADLDQTQDGFHVHVHDTEESSEVDFDEQDDYSDYSRVDEEESKQQAASTDDLRQAVQLSPQDYIPRRMVGLEYGDKPCQMKLPPNPIRDKNVFLRQGSNGILVCTPSSIHFPGYVFGRKYSQLLRITNTTPDAQRFHVLPPAHQLPKIGQLVGSGPSGAAAVNGGGGGTYSGFNWRCVPSKVGSLSPGLSQSLLVTFIPPSEEVRVFADKICIHALGENLVVPLYAYPAIRQARSDDHATANATTAASSNPSSLLSSTPSSSSSSSVIPTQPSSSSTSSSIFPSRLDLGRCAIGRRRTRRITITSEASVGFDWELNVDGGGGGGGGGGEGVGGSGGTTNSSSTGGRYAEFLVYPLRGTIPAQGSTTITIDFLPKRSVLSRMTLSFRCAEFDPSAENGGSATVAALSRQHRCVVIGQGIHLHVRPSLASIEKQRQAKMRAEKEAAEAEAIRARITRTGNARAREEARKLWRTGAKMNQNKSPARDNRSLS